MKSILKEILDNYIQEKKKIFKGNRLASYIRNEAKKQVESSLSNNTEQYLVKSSAGQGQWAEIPWIAVLDKTITKSPTFGYYIVYLFRADMSAVYLSFNQGWTYFEERFGIRLGKNYISRVAQSMKASLGKINDFTETNIDLGSSRTLARGYELGHVCGKRYEQGNIPDSQVLTNDLNKMIEVYSDLKMKFGADFYINNIFDIVKRSEENPLKRDDLEDTQYYGITYDVEPSKLEDKPIQKQGKTSGSVNRPKRDPKISRQALKMANYLCEIDSSHITFLTAASSTNYVESHHLIPLSLQDEFEYSIDVPANIVSLCPNCHRKLHYGKYEDTKELVKKLFNERIERLKKCKINIKQDKLLEIYKNKER